MRRVLPILSLLLLSPRALGDASDEPPALSHYLRDPAPWLALRANSDQRQPVYMGLSPRDLVLGMPRLKNPVLRASLRALGNTQFKYIASRLREPSVEIEAWPMQEWQGRQTWAMAHWRKTGQTRWTWLHDGLVGKPLAGDQPQPVLPHNLDPQLPNQAKQIFADFLSLPGLYDKPLFGECVWTRKHDDAIQQAWIDPDQVAAARTQQSAYHHMLCRAIGQPARFNEIPQTFVIKVHGAEVTWPAQIRWQSEPGTASIAETSTEQVAREPAGWPADFQVRYASDIQILSGQTEAEYSSMGRSLRTRFTHKNSADAKNQLLDIVSYLEYRYRQLGIVTERESFTWRDIQQANLIAKIPAAPGGHKLPPIVMADHIDTAFCEDVFARSGERVSAPGADDNMAATAALLQAGQRFAGQRFPREIWLYHLTGEEFPGDDLGARVATSGWLRRKQAIGGIVLLDMIGYRKKPDRIFQINAGTSAESMRIAQVAMSISIKNRNGYSPVLRAPFDSKSYLYNTDGLIFSEAGYPVILFNEHINRLENLDRPHYHQSTDALRTLDLDYASTVAQNAILTVAALAAQSP